LNIFVSEVSVLLLVNCVIFDTGIISAMLWH